MSEDNAASSVPCRVDASLNKVRYEIERALKESDRDEGAAKLVAVSKMQSATQILPALDAKQRIFGENYVQEASTKWLELKERFSHVELHMIGPLQSNKVKEALQVFDVIETLDRPSLAQALAKEIQKQGRAPKLFVQVNTGDETQKAGISIGNLASFLKDCATLYDLKIEGLMCIPPFDQPPSPHFALLRQYAREHALPSLSMGMSNDFEQAIMLGATHVRVGSRIFGERAVVINN